MQIIYIYNHISFFPLSRFLMMFNPYAGSLSSTGEPPTESSETSAQNIISSGNDSHQETNLFLSSSRSLSVQEPDSGYEASPSSIAEGHSNQRFFGEQSASRQAEIRQVTSDDEFDWEFTGFHFSDSESELDEYVTCDCSSSPCSCFRTDSSTTNFTAISNCDNSRCNSSELSFNRPSSHPIQIPNVSSFRLSSDVSSRMLNVTPLTRSFPMDFSPRLRLGFTIPERGLPLSWPIASPLRNNCRSVALSVSRSNPSNRDTHMNNNRHNMTRQHLARNRRNIIDSEDSSCGSSDDEGSEDDVFSKFLFINSSYEKFHGWKCIYIGESRV